MEARVANPMEAPHGGEASDEGARNVVEGKSKGRRQQLKCWLIDRQNWVSTNLQASLRLDAAVHDRSARTAPIDDQPTEVEAAQQPAAPSTSEREKQSSVTAKSRGGLGTDRAREASGLVTIVSDLTPATAIEANERFADSDAGTHLKLGVERTDGRFEGEDRKKGQRDDVADAGDNARKDRRERLRRLRVLKEWVPGSHSFRGWQALRRSAGLLARETQGKEAMGAAFEPRSPGVPVLPAPGEASQTPLIQSTAENASRITQKSTAGGDLHSREEEVVNAFTETSTDPRQTTQKEGEGEEKGETKIGSSGETIEDAGQMKGDGTPTADGERTLAKVVNVSREFRGAEERHEQISQSTNGLSSVGISSSEGSSLFCTPYTSNHVSNQLPGPKQLSGADQLIRPNDAQSTSNLPLQATEGTSAFVPPRPPLRVAPPALDSRQEPVRPPMKVLPALSALRRGVGLKDPPQEFVPQNWTAFVPPSAPRSMFRTMSQPVSPLGPPTFSQTLSQKLLEQLAQAEVPFAQTQSPFAQSWHTAPMQTALDECAFGPPSSDTAPWLRQPHTGPHTGLPQTGAQSLQAHPRQAQSLQCVSPYATRLPPTPLTASSHGDAFLGYGGPPVMALSRRPQSARAFRHFQPYTRGSEEERNFERALRWKQINSVKNSADYRFFRSHFPKRDPFAQIHSANTLTQLPHALQPPHTPRARESIKGGCEPPDPSQEPVTPRVDEIGDWAEFQSELLKWRTAVEAKAKGLTLLNLLRPCTPACSVP